MPTYTEIKTPKRRLYEPDAPIPRSGLVDGPLGDCDRCGAHAHLWRMRSGENFCIACKEAAIGAQRVAVQAILDRVRGGDNAAAPAALAGQAIEIVQITEKTWAFRDPVGGSLPGWLAYAPPEGDTDFGVFYGRAKRLLRVCKAIERRGATVKIRDLDPNNEGDGIMAKKVKKAKATATEGKRPGRKGTLPAAGTELVHVFRRADGERVVAKAKVTSEGVRFDGTEYTSLSSAGVAATKKYGNPDRPTVNGKFWADASTLADREERAAANKAKKAAKADKPAEGRGKRKGKKAKGEGAKAARAAAGEGEGSKDDTE